MNKFIFSFIGAAVCTSLAPAVATSAEPMPERFFYFGGHASQYYYDIDGSVSGDQPDETTLPGIQTGYRINPDWSVQLWWERNNFNSEEGLFDGNLNALLTSARYHFNDTSLLGFEPYIGLALGELEVDVNEKSDETMGGTEFGLQQRLRPHWLIDLGARPLYSFDNERWDAHAYLALNFLFTSDSTSSSTSNSRSDAENQNALKQKPVQDISIATVFSDNDGDGINDSIDQCPKTAAGAEVDQSGCEADSDGDGIKNSLDQCPDSAARVKVNASGCNEVLEEALRTTLYIEFAHNTAEVSDVSMAEVAKLSELLYQYPDAQLTLEGHTDNGGSAAYNMHLSQQRAEGVKQALIDNFSIAAERVTAIGRGEATPIADNTTAQGRSRNRRVEAILQ